MKADLHIHTCASPDAEIPPSKLTAYAGRAGLDAVAITDHDSTRSWRKAEEYNRGLIVIRGQEVKTRSSSGNRTGEVLGLFLTEPLRGGTLLETLDQINAQGAIAAAPHPFDRFRSGVGTRILAVGGRFHAIECVNGRAYLERFNKEAAHFANKHGYPPIGGSDAHFPYEVGRCWTQADGADDSEGLRRSILRGDVTAHGFRAPLRYHLHSLLPVLRSIWQR